MGVTHTPSSAQCCSTCRRFSSVQKIWHCCASATAKASCSLPVLYSPSTNSVFDGELRTKSSNVTRHAACRSHIEKLSCKWRTCTPPRTGEPVHNGELTDFSHLTHPEPVREALASGPGLLYQDTAHRPASLAAPCASPSQAASTSRRCAQWFCLLPGAGRITDQALTRN